jgi:hypothetical protein
VLVNVNQTTQHKIFIKTVLLRKVNDSPALKYSHCVEVGCVAYVLEEYIDSTFRVKVSGVSECSCLNHETHEGPSFGK